MMENVTVTFSDKKYHVLYVGIHGGCGMGANEPYKGRFISSGRKRLSRQNNRGSIG